MLILFYLAYANYIYLINPINPTYQSNLSILFVRSILSYQCIYIYKYIYTIYIYVNRSWLPLGPARPLCSVQRCPAALTGVGWAQTTHRLSARMLSWAKVRPGVCSGGRMLKTFPGRCLPCSPSKDFCLWPSKVPPPKRKQMVSPPSKWGVWTEAGCP